MSLRRQLTLVSLLLLCLPWAGCQFVREVEGALREAQARSLTATAQAVSATLSQKSALLYPYPGRRSHFDEAGSQIYAAPAAGPVIVDGYGDGWQDVGGTAFFNTASPPLSVTVRAQTRSDTLYLLMNIADPQVTYDNPGVSSSANGDRLTLRLQPASTSVDLVITTAAPGSVRARAYGKLPPRIDPGRIRGYWQDAVGGYTLELELPLAYTGGKLGFWITDGDAPTGSTAGNVSANSQRDPPPLLFQPTGLQTALQAFSGIDGAITVVDRQRWLLATQTDRPDSDTDSNTFWLLRELYRAILAGDAAPPAPSARRPGQLEGTEVEAALRGEATYQRYRDPGDPGRTLLSVAAPIRDDAGIAGAVIARQSSDTYISLTDQAFSHLLGYSALALLTAVLGLLAYASLLSIRIRRLSAAARSAISADGRVTATFPRSTANDEIGDLSRQYADLLERLREHNDYLRSLSRKLSHELRTPIAVIRSSLDNLEQVGEDQGPYRERAREGLARLQQILNAMSEASRLEESIRSQAKTTLDLVPLLRDVAGVYRDVYPRRHITLAIEPDTARQLAAGELLVQALDKLMDNAVSFSGEGSTITLGLGANETHWLLSVNNEGPALPAGAAEHLFEPMVSLRDTGDDGVHLGLGLHIARLVAEYHGGNMSASNRTDGQGVSVYIALPKAS